jgi:hypothetical protein
VKSHAPNVPWFVRAGDRLVDRYEGWVFEKRGTAEFHQRLLHFGATRDDESRDWLAGALARYDYLDASRFAKYYLILWFTVALLFGLSLRGCGEVLLLLLLAPALMLFDHWNRRRKAAKNLLDGEALVYRKVDVKEPPAGSRVFQSYWARNDAQPVELDHPMELRAAVEESNEWWQWLMPVPKESNGRVSWVKTHFDVGLVHHDAGGNRRLVAGGVVYFSYDPWTGRVDTGGYE